MLFNLSFSRFHLVATIPIYFLLVISQVLQSDTGRSRPILPFISPSIIFKTNLSHRMMCPINCIHLGSIILLICFEFYTTFNAYRFVLFLSSLSSSTSIVSTFPLFLILSAFWEATPKKIVIKKKKKKHSRIANTLQNVGLNEQFSRSYCYAPTC